MLVPFGDFLNHTSDGATHYLVNTVFEGNEKKAPEAYLLKKKKFNLAMFEKKELLLTKEDRETFFTETKFKREYISRNIVK
jgi:hypothetical protein